MDEIASKVAAEIGKEVAKDVYSDAVKPTANSSGQIVALIPRAIKAACLPLEKWILNKEYNLAETQKLLTLKLNNVNPENIVPPDAHVAVPALQYISYCMDNDELRDMYANLLANSMNKVVKNGVHPSFVEIIKQLSPDEAKILREIKKLRSFPVIDLRYQKDNGDYIDIINNFSDVGYKTLCEYSWEISKYLDNLMRLGLIARPILSSFTDKTKYDSLKNNANFIKYLEVPKRYIDAGFKKAEINEGHCVLTAYGSSFCSMCIGDAIVKSK